MSEVSKPTFSPTRNAPRGALKATVGSLPHFFPAEADLASPVSHTVRLKAGGSSHTERNR